MRYNLGNGVVIRSENAAQSGRNTSKHLRGIIADLPIVGSSFDYGCGKLRYAAAILETTETLTVVDSEIQLSRTQIIDGAITTVRAALGGNNRATAANVQEFDHLNMRFDRGFCINVLSVIPIDAIRRRVLGLIRSKLRPGAPCLFVIQYRNSRFTERLQLPNAQQQRDGILVDSLRGFSYYGLIPPDRLTTMLQAAGFEIITRTVHEGSVYVWAGAPIVT
jgi:SAM-dependent methyltransferase